MKNLYTLALVLLCAFVGKAQIVNIPDAAFKAKLLAADATNTIATDIDVNYVKIDTNNDGEIQVSEALLITSLDVSGNDTVNGGIYSLDGIESFVNLWGLNCRCNLLTSLNVSSLIDLDGLACGYNHLSSLNVSGLTYLSSLSCENNYLSNLNVSGLYNLSSLSCEFNQLSALDVSSLTNLHQFYCYQNGLTTLNLSSNTNLHYLDCQYNQISTLNLAGLNLTSLRCNSNQLTNLDVSNLTNLQSLDCNFNHLPSLNLNGLTNLQYLDCSANQIPIINVNGLTNLLKLDCSMNQLSNLDVSNLTNLQSLYCFSNQLPSLNVSYLTNLQELNCRNNQLPSLNVSNLANLHKLMCNYNQLSSLIVTGLTNLQQLACSNNQLPSLIVTGLTNLQELNCGNNQIPSLDLSGLINLQYLYCNNNQIPSLDVSGSTNLLQLNCSNNQIPSLDLSGSTNLLQLYCSNNQIPSLDVSGSTNLLHLNCSYNQLTNLLMKNGSIEYIFILDFSGNPNLQYICADEGQIPDVQSKITQYGYTNCNVNSYCTFTPGGTFYTIQGTNRFDSNNNGCDVNDNMLPSMKLSFTDGTVTGGLIPDTSGSYHFDVQAGMHTFTPVFENPNYFNVSPASATVTFPTTASPFVQNFCVTANGTHPDLEVVLIPITRARPGFDAVYKLYYKNKGNTTQSGNISLIFNDAVLDLVSANPVVSTQTFNTLTWNFSTLVPLATGEIVFTLNVNSPMETPAVIGGDLLSFLANINPISGDETPSDNSFGYKQIVVNAFDPNEKECIEGNNIALAKVGDYVHYIIRFENDGTANAQNIVVKDMIDTAKFDIATLIPESGSATYTTRITNTNQVEFVFQNINLPFATGSNTGYVAFKIKTKSSLVTGNTFSNTASIYFDYNFPINTNTATTTIQALATQDFEFSNYFTLYPNPAKNVLNINTKSTIEVHSLTIYNLLGQVVLAIPNAQNLNAVDVSSLKTGNYFLKITSDKGSATEKFIKE